MGADERAPVSPPHPADRARAPRPRPERDLLLSLPLHVVLRDYPETLAVLRAQHVEPRAYGGRSLTRLAAEREDGEAILAALLDALEWRPSPA